MVWVYLSNKFVCLFLFFLVFLSTLGVVCAVDNDVNPVNLLKKYPTGSNGVHNVLWVRGSEMHDIDFNVLKESNIDTVFLNYGALGEYGRDDVVKWIEDANRHGIGVHIWMQVLYHDGFQSPVVNNTINEDLLEKDINDSTVYANIPGIDGIVLDYLRYPGNNSFDNVDANAVTSFVVNITDNVKSVNKDLVVSGTLMPEGDRIISEYGQNLTILSSKLDYILPMAYKGNYEQDSAWIREVSDYFVNHSMGAKVIVSLQSYTSDYNLTKLSDENISGDIDSAYAGGSVGVGIFRYGLTDFEDIGDNLDVHNFLSQRLYYYSS